ncbi:tripartite tricarboxylate transporter substrate binding protein [Roseomonas sp. NAR14]|uniref:Tripartite tricarboxylate transporter substrate binding protein n=1 Tax=Roseomonas acroporae TaxID=2937791 RepID=A0A9X1Y5Y4_9PROT|nr:tripartite tricarboxylate transporter substrate binding protein [Roseomonas acroporae]MCK8784101.1 tripartite tricarboxylate transporter substrate binding protein [Roseomonas acroporae]
MEDGIGGRGAGTGRRAAPAGAAALLSPLMPPGGRALAQGTGRQGGGQDAGDWPSRPVKVIVTYPPGGGADTVARILFARLSETLGQQFVIENRGGAGGTIGAQALARSTPDGYTLMHDATAFSVNPSLFRSLPYDARRDFAPAFLAVVVPNLLVATPSVPVRTVADVIALAKSRPGGLDWASAGNGSAQHLALALFAKMAGITLNHVPYRGGGPALNDIIGGQINFFFSNATSSIGHVKSGAVRGIAHTATGRMAALPDLPPVADTVPGYECLEWNGVFAPAATPGPVIAKLNAALNAVVAEPAIAERLAGLGAATRPNTPEEFRAFLESEMTKWGRVVREAGISVD